MPQWKGVCKSGKSRDSSKVSASVQSQPDSSGWPTDS